MKAIDRAPECRHYAYHADDRDVHVDYRLTTGMRVVGLPG